MRILVRQGILKESDVSINFFEPQHNSVAIHNISLDKYGNLQNAPPSYRDFFLKVRWSRFIGQVEGRNKVYSGV